MWLAHNVIAFHMNEHSVVLLATGLHRQKAFSFILSVLNFTAGLELAGYYDDNPDSNSSHVVFASHHTQP